MTASASVQLMNDRHTRDFSLVYLSGLSVDQSFYRRRITRSSGQFDQLLRDMLKSRSGWASSHFALDNRFPLMKQIWSPYEPARQFYRSHSLKLHNFNFAVQRL